MFLFCRFSIFRIPSVCVYFIASISIFIYYNILVITFTCLIVFSVCLFLLDIFFIYISNAVLFPSFCSESPLYPPPTQIPKPPTFASWPWYSPVLGHIIFARPRSSPAIDDRLGHPLLHLQLEKQTLESTG